MPQCIDNTTMSAPARFSARAAARMRGTSIRFAAHGVGGVMPLKPNA